MQAVQYGTPNPPKISHICGRNFATRSTLKSNSSNLESNASNRNSKQFGIEQFEFRIESKFECFEFGIEQ